MFPNVIRTYNDFVIVTEQKRDLYAEINPGHLTYEGREAYEMYQSLDFDTLYADSAAEMLKRIADDPVYRSYEQSIPANYRKVIFLLERLAKEEAEAADIVEVRQ